MKTIRRYGNIVIFVCVILEMLIWPSFDNFIGCLMTIVSWVIFSKIGLNEQVIREHIFAWLVFLSMSLYRILPLIATMLEGHSIGYNFLVPLSTYCGETLLYLISALAFYLAVNYKKSLLNLKLILFHIGFYKRANSQTLWIMGLIGFFLKVYVTVRYVEYGNVIGKVLEGLTFFQYAPILLCFPALLDNNQSDKVIELKRTSILYIILLVVLSFATNSRLAMLQPIMTFFLLFLLSCLNCSKNILNINVKYIVGGILVVFWVIPIVNDISLAMLYNRQFRTKTNRNEIFMRTFETFCDKELMEQLRLLKEKKEIKATGDGNFKTWSETYVSNFALNRFCNLKITDNTLYHAKRVGYPNEKMYDAFWLDVAAVFPTPVIKFLGINYDKNVRFSRGDKLKALSANRHPSFSLLVTSHLADGLLVFGYWYFPIEFLLFYLRFLLLDTFLIRYKGKIFYSVFALITISSFLQMFMNASGGCDSLGYMLRDYWQDIILFMFGFTLLSKISLKL